MYVDSHTHLNDEKLLEDIDGVISRAREAGLSLIVVNGWDIPPSMVAVKLSEKYEEVYAFVGVHPENLDDISEESIEQLKALSKREKVLGIGEIGLDYRWFKEESHRNLQKEWFIRQIDLANELNLPVQIHCRDAYGDGLALLKAHPVKHGGVLHCYSGSVELLREFAKLGFYFGFDGPITYKNAVEPKECVKECPLDKILSETDAPYLTPVPFRGKTNEPSKIPYIVAQMAELKGLTVEEMAGAIKQNLERMVGLNG